MFASVFSPALRRTALALALSAAAGAAQASTLHVELDTGFLSGADGYLDLNFSRNVDSLDASALVSALSGVGAEAPVLNGDVAAQGSAAYLFRNSTDFNDLFQSVHFGGKVSFNVSFSGLPGLPSSTNQSVFSVALFGADGVSTLGNTDAFGNLLHMTWLPAADDAGQVTWQVSDSMVGSITAVPEPSAWLMLGAGLGLLGLVRRR